jgi:hypothetical protein
MKFWCCAGIATATALAFMAAVPSRAQAPADITDLVDARAAGGETQLEARGYALVHASTVRDQKWGFWWKGRTRQCAAVSTMEGRFAAINTVPAANCEQSAGTGTAAAAAAAPAPAPGPALQLLCYGQGTKSTMENKSGLQWNNETKKYETTSRLETGKESYSAQLAIEINGNRGRIQLPKPLIPPIHSGGIDGWWELTNLTIDSQSISGRFKVNLLNSPVVRIDRRIGRIQISGMEDFSGTCENAAEVRDHPRF